MDLVWFFLGHINGKTLLVGLVVGLISMAYLIKSNP